MSVRNISVKLGLAAVAASSLALTVLAPANADTKPADPNYVLGTTVIGVGSDTIQWVDDQLSADYNTFNSGQAVKTPYWANFDACVGKDVGGTGANPDGSGFPCGADNTGTKVGIKRDEGIVDPAAAGSLTLPSGSGDGRTLLRNPSDKLFGDIAYARSSGPINSTDQQNGLIALPFAVDKIVVATKPGGPAPASLTGQQILKIYNGTYTNWNQVGGKNGKIHPYLPKGGSSTLNAFLSFLSVLDGKPFPPGTDGDQPSHAAASQTWQGPGNTITDANWNAPGGVNVEEHDPSVIIADPNAIEPFSYGRAQLANKNAHNVRIEGGWSADRELYHVVRSQNITGAASTPFVYGSDSNVLENLFSSTGWLCTNATAQADIASSGFWPLPTGSANGNCGVKNTNTLDTIDANTSVGIGEGAATTTSAIFLGGALHISVAAGDATTPTGSVQVVGSKATAPGAPAPAASFHTTVALGADGTATVKLPATVSGKNVFEVAYLPTNFGANSSAGGHTALAPSYKQLVQTVPVTKVGTTMKVTATPLTLANATKSTKVTTTVKATTGTAKPTGTVSIFRGTKKVGTGTLRRGTVTITVKGTSLVKGKNKLVVKYAATGSFKAPSRFPSITVTRTR